MSGRVEINGRPADGLPVVFEPGGGSSRIALSGRYNVLKSALVRGMFIGKERVAITDVVSEHATYDAPLLGSDPRHDNVTSLPPAFTPLTDPIHEYDHSVGSSITGGYVYRGASTAFRGRYFFADFIRSRVWSLALTIGTNGEATASDVREHTSELGGASELANVASFGVDASGELYIVSYTRGVILRIVLPPAAPTGLRIIR